MNSHIYLKNGLEYLTRRTDQVFIPLMRFQEYILISGIFPVLLKYPFIIFSFIFTCFIVSASNIPKYL